ncbi:MAG: hypothetical protein RSD63_06245 [Eubacterium sp.]
MTQEKYKWDIEALNEHLQRLSCEKENLEQSEQFFKNLNTEVKENWKSLAGTEYESSLRIDFKCYEKVIQALEASNIILDKVANQIYINCECEVQKKLTTMASNMSR